MDTTEILQKFTEHTPISTLVFGVVYYLRQIKLSFQHFEKTVSAMQASVDDLNRTMTIMLVEKDHIRDDIALIRENIRILEERVTRGKS